MSQMTPPSHLNISSLLLHMPGLSVPLSMMKPESSPSWTFLEYQVMQIQWDLDVLGSWVHSQL